jgi:hypothetical protein
MSKRCVEPNCYNDAPKGRLCSKHQTRRWRANNVIRNSYNSLRAHARERFISFDITWNYWKEFCERTRYHELKGTGAEDMSIDRPNSLRGYTDDNIRMLSVRDNTFKQHNEDAKQRRSKMVEEIKQQYGGEAPF